MGEAGGVMQTTLDRATASTRPRPTVFTMPFGLASLAGVWSLMASFYGAPRAVSDALFIVAACAWVVLIAVVLAQWARRPGTLGAELSDPVLGPFWALPAIVGMLLAIGLSSGEPAIAETAFFVFFALTVAVVVLMVAGWVIRGVDRCQVHPGYFLPTVAGFQIAAQGAAEFGLSALAWGSFTVSIAFWAGLTPVVLARLRTVPLPTALGPTRAIELAPPALAGATYFDLTRAAPDPVAYAFLIAAALLAAGQLRAVPRYARLPFGQGFWAFTFPCVSVAALALRWLRIEHPTGAPVYALLAGGAVSLLVAAIAVRSVLAIPRGKLLFHSSSAPAVAAVVASQRSRPTPAVDDKRLEGAFNV
jgi:tellurite resistance protein